MIDGIQIICFPPSLDAVVGSPEIGYDGFDGVVEVWWFSFSVTRGADCSDDIVLGDGYSPGVGPIRVLVITFCCSAFDRHGETLGKEETDNHYNHYQND